MTYACHTWEYAADAHLLKLRICRTEYSALLETLTGAYQSANCTRTKSRVTFKIPYV
jgi:hypothetical protein